MTGGGGLPTPFMDINQMNLLQHLHAQQAAFAAQQAAVSTASGGNPMMFPFLPSMGMGFQGMDPRFQHMPQVGVRLFSFHMDGNNNSNDNFRTVAFRYL